MKAEAGHTTKPFKKEKYSSFTQSVPNDCNRWKVLLFDSGIEDINRMLIFATNDGIATLAN